MHRCLVVLVTVFAATLVAAPIGHLGDTLRVDTGKILADVTVSSVQPVDPPPGFGYNRVGVPFQMLTDFTFDGVTPFADAYKSRPSDAPDALTNAPAGSVVRGGVYWEAYRDPVSNVVLLDKKTGVHLAQWNL
jgi:hypothetical protein